MKTGNETNTLWIIASNDKDYYTLFDLFSGILIYFGLLQMFVRTKGDLYLLFLSTKFIALKYTNKSLFSLSINK